MYASLTEENPEADNCDECRVGRPVRFKIGDKNNVGRKKVFGQDYIYVRLVS